jgi:diguanylate cyclase (GGDEF)-like protein/putative nucleotidyltransferase with HDIG domain
MKLRAPRAEARSELQLWLLAVPTGVWTTFGIATASTVYITETWNRPHRLTIFVLWAVAIAGAAVVRLLPTERIIAARYRDVFFLSWSALDIAVIAALSIADGGAQSPFALLFFLTLAFSALFYPLALVLIVSALNIAAFVTVGALGSGADGSYLWLFTACLGATAYMCACQARNHDRQRAELLQVSRSDPLTGCLNRRGFEERLNGELDRAQRSARPFGLILLDLDGFKEVNDRFGHAAGDQLLIWVARAIEAVIRPMDALGRLGGDEFAVMLPGVGQADLLGARLRIADAVAERASLSLGVACFPANGADAEEMISHADGELYAAKRRLTLGGKDLSWAAALADAVDSRLGGEHSYHTARLAAAIAERLGWEEHEIRLLRIAAMLHDVGKVALSDGVLQKPGPLTDDERREIEEHPVIGAALVARIEGLETIVPWIRHSHERIDGSGYPDRLAGEAIPLASRILLVADAFDVMRRDRPYQRARSQAAAVEELRRGAGTQFDSRCVEALIEVVEAEATPFTEARRAAG